MIVKDAARVLALALGLSVAAGSPAWSQEAGKTKDDALDSLLEKLAEPAGGAARKGEESAKPGAPGAKSDRPAKPSQPQSKPEEAKDRSRDQAKPGPGPAGEKAAPASRPKRDGAATVAPKDQEIDDLLQKLGETKETPAPDDRPHGGAATEEKKDERPPTGAQRPKLGGKDKEIDERLEELTGRRKKRKADDEQRSGPIGQIIKEMREVEQKLGKPDTGEGTRGQQKQIVKQIESLIEEMKRSGSSMRMMVRRVRRPGQRPGQQPGQTTGALARGAPPMKPAKPTTRHSNVGGKEVWGHLPEELRQEMENIYKEDYLTSKKELIERYLLSVTKGKLVREE
ncbi:MAG TPA: hypothetical protein VFF52_29875 [Isosphaeraceae bacterium]|nr:hypothetical protein [Isosphaeraceae bacterium]